MKVTITSMQCFDSSDSDARESQFWEIMETPEAKKILNPKCISEAVENYKEHADLDFDEAFDSDEDNGLTIDQIHDKVLEQLISCTITGYVNYLYNYDKDWIGSDEYATDSIYIEIVD